MKAAHLSPLPVAQCLARMHNFSQVGGKNGIRCKCGLNYRRKVYTAAAEVILLEISKTRKTWWGCLGVGIVQAGLGETYTPEGPQVGRRRGLGTKDFETRQNRRKWLEPGVSDLQSGGDG